MIIITVTATMIVTTEITYQKKNNNQKNDK